MVTQSTHFDPSGRMQLFGMIQVAGVRSEREARMLIDCGTTHVGVPLGPGIRTPDISVPEARNIALALSRSARFVCITYLREPQDVAAFVREAGMDMVQLHGESTPEETAALRALWPELTILKSLVVGAPGKEADTLALARAHAPFVDGFLTDTYDPETGARGATGRTHDWNRTREVVLGVSVPVIAAGGLHPGNVGAAIRATGCAGVDAHTGLENADGAKDETMVREFARCALEAFREVHAG